MRPDEACWGRVMSFELLLAGYIMAVGLAISGASTYLYQWAFKTQAILRFDGKTFFHTVAHLVMSFVCGPIIMLQMGWRSEKDGTISLGSALLSAFIAFGWSFITGLLFLGAYFAIFP
jgi:hypothetical protein